MPGLWFVLGRMRGNWSVLFVRRRWLRRQRRVLWLLKFRRWWLQPCAVWCLLLRWRRRVALLRRKDVLLRRGRLLRRRRSLLRRQQRVRLRLSCALSWRRGVRQLRRPVLSTPRLLSLPAPLIGIVCWPRAPSGSLVFGRSVRRTAPFRVWWRNRRISLLPVRPISPLLPLSSQLLRGR